MGPLQGIKVIELAGIGPGPMAGMMLADMGAEVICVERSTTRLDFQAKDVSFRGKRSVVLDLKQPKGIDALLRLTDTADALIDPYRPGAAERLGIGPQVCLSRNAKLVFARMTGWGQSGPLAQAPGHDINYIAITGALRAIGRKGAPPVPPLNLVGDMGGGGMLLAYGIVCAVLEARTSGRGQIVDAAMVDGAAQQLWMLHGFHAQGTWDTEQLGTNSLDGGAHYYDTYETRDGKFIAIGAIEPQFYARLLELTGVDKTLFADQMDKTQWPQLKREFARLFLTRTRDEWCRLLEGDDACVAPVLSLTEAPHHPHNQARGTYLTLDGVTQPAPAPRFSRTPGEVRHGTRPPGIDGAAVLSDAGIASSEIQTLLREGVLRLP
jgi:alpha-methylacyl-CoA racemase